MGKEADYKFDHMELKNGPLQDRSCKDIVCCALFSINAFIFFVLFCTATADGDPMKLVKMFDSGDGNVSLLILEQT